MWYLKTQKLKATKNLFKNCPKQLKFEIFKRILKNHFLVQSLTVLWCLINDSYHKTSHKLKCFRSYAIAITKNEQHIAG